MSITYLVGLLRRAFRDIRDILIVLTGYLFHSSPPRDFVWTQHQDNMSSGIDFSTVEEYFLQDDIGTDPKTFNFVRLSST